MTTFAGRMGQPSWYGRVWRADGVYLDRSQEQTNGACELETPLLEFRFPLAVGSSWSNSSTCKDGRTLSVAGTVTRIETLVIGATPVPTFVIEGKTVWTRGSNMNTTPTTRWFSTDLGLEIRTLQRSESDSAVTVDTTLQSTTPGPVSTDAPPPGY